MFIAFSILISLFTLFTLLLLWGWEQIPFCLIDTGDIVCTNTPLISVIIPVRNEAENILCLLEDLAHQTLPLSCFEVLVVNDCSEDDTATLVEEYSKKSPYKLQLISLPSHSFASPKKVAIQTAIQLARGELMVTTDGDCRVMPFWLQYLAYLYQQKEAKLISGGVTFYEEKTCFEKLQTIEFASLVGSGAACLQLKVPNMCNGANLAYPRKVFEEVQGFEGVDHIASGDDEFLLQKIARLYPDQLFFLKNEQSTVYTKAQQNLKNFYSQRKRWGSKWKYYRDLRTKIIAFFIFAVNFVLLATLVLTCFGIYPPLVYLLQIVLKFLTEFIYLRTILHYFNKGKLIRWIPLIQLIYPFYVVLFGLTAQGSKYQWKGRSLH